MTEGFPDEEFFRSLDEKMERDLQIRKIISTAMTKACRAMGTPGTRREKAILVAAALQEAEEAIIDMFEK